MGEGPAEESVPVTRSDWWKSPAGMNARKWLIAWGAVEHVRRETGDPTAFPSQMGDFRGGGRGPSDVADVLTIHAMIDRTLAEMYTNRERELLRFIYVDGMIERSKNQFVFSDGSRSEVMTDEEVAENPPAVRTIHCHRESWREVKYDLRRFAAPEVDAMCREWGLKRAGVLEARHRMIAKCVAEDMGL